MDVAGEGEELLLGQHGDGFDAGGLGGLFQVQGLSYRDDEDEVLPLGSLGHQGLKDLLRGLAQDAGGSDPVGDVVLVQVQDVVGAGDIGGL